MVNLIIEIRLWGIRGSIAVGVDVAGRINGLVAVVRFFLPHEGL
jgi:hypothetical protein